MTLNVTTRGFALLLWLCFAAVTPSTAQQPDKRKSILPHGKFNYTYIRFAYFTPSAGFNNPMIDGFTGCEYFTLRSDLPNSFRLGLESGKVRHFMGLDLGTDMLKLGINSGVAVQGFGPGSASTSKAVASTDGTYIVRLGLGPQLSFKPIDDLRLGLYYRAGIAFVYSSYRNEETTTLAPDLVRVNRADIDFLHRAYNGDIGLDCSWRSLCISMTYSMAKAHPAKGSLVDPQTIDAEHNTYSSQTMRDGIPEGVKTVTPIDPVVKWHRLGIAIGFAF